jgi:hypothetical protein
MVFAPDAPTGLVIRLRVLKNGQEVGIVSIDVDSSVLAAKNKIKPMVAMPAETMQLVLLGTDGAPKADLTNLNDALLTHFSAVDDMYFSVVDNSGGASSLGLVAQMHALEDASTKYGATFGTFTPDKQPGSVP